MKTKNLLQLIQANTATLPSYENLFSNPCKMMNSIAPQSAIFAIIRIKRSLGLFAMLLTMMLGFSQQGFSQTNTWDGSEDTNWNKGSNWTAGVVPDASTDVVVNSGMPRQPVISDPDLYQIRSLTINSGATVTSYYELHIADDLSGEGEMINGASGTLNIGGDATIATLTITGDNNTVRYNGTGAQIVKATTYYNLTISGSGTKTLGENANAGGVLIVEVGATLDLGDNSLGAASRPSSIYLACGNPAGSVISGSGTLYLGGTLQVGHSAGTGGATISCPVDLGGWRLFDVANDGTLATDLTISGPISGDEFGVTKNIGTGTLTLSSANNSFTGGLTIMAGIVQLGSDNVVPQRTLTLYGGTLSTGAAEGYNATAGTLALFNNSTIHLGTGDHSLHFAASNNQYWSGTLTITGWTGTAGLSNTDGGKIYFGGNESGLTSGISSQLAQISFAGYPGTAILLSDGELVPQAVSVCTPGTIALSSGEREQTVNVNSTITEIVFSVGGSATGAEAAGLPAGVSGVFSSGTFTISGTPTAFGRFYFEVTTTGTPEPCEEATDWSVIIVNPPADYCHGSGYVVTSEYDIDESLSQVYAEYALDPPDAAVAILDYTNEIIELDLTGGGTMRPSGSTITLKAGASCNGSSEAAVIRVQRSDNKTAWYETGSFTLSECSLGDYTIVLNGNTRYINITKTNGMSKAALIDAVTYECAPTCAPTLSLGSIGDVCSGVAVYVPYFDASNIFCGSGTESPTDFSINWLSDDVLDWSSDFSVAANCNGTEGSFFIDMIPKEEGGSIPAGTYSGSLTLKNGDCTSLEYIITATILSSPEAPIAQVISGSTQICGEGFVTLQANGSAGATYIWYENNDFLSAGQNQTFIFFPPNNVPGTYTYQVTQQLPGGCESGRATVDITVKEVPTTTVMPAIYEIIGIGSVELTASGADSYSWIPAEGLSSTTDAIVTAAPIKNTTYIVTGTSNGCSSSDEAIIYVQETCKNSGDQYEPNNSMSGNLFTIPIDLTISANLLNAKDPDWYKLDIGTLAKYSLNCVKFNGTVNPTVELYGSNGRRLKSISRTQPNIYNLAIGTFYIKVSAGVKTYLCYTLQVVEEGAAVGAIASFEDTKSAEIEPTPDGICKIWPNPTNNEFQIYNGNKYPIQMKVMDVTGRQIETIENVGIAETVVFGSKYKPGIYFVKTSENGIQKVFKLIKQ